jgi:hypothetical protein
MFHFLRTKIGISLLLALIIIGAAFAFKYRNTEKSIKKTGTTIALEKVVKDSLDRDDDNDGLKNWEEVLYKTDPKVADTDNDGIKDGEEVKQNNDPLVFGTGKTATNNAEMPTKPIVYTATDRFSQEIFTQYIEAKKQGIDISDEISAKIADSVLEQDYSDKIPLYTTSSLKVNTDSSTNSLKTYANAIGLILKTPPETKMNEFLIFQKLGNESVENYRDDLMKIQKRYEGMRTKLLALPAPKGFAESQIEIINSISLFIEATNGAITLEEDPIGALGKIARYETGVNLLTKAVFQLKALFISHKVIFSPNESGYILMQ